jgi:hypothetical protein
MVAAVVLPELELVLELVLEEEEVVVAVAEVRTHLMEAEVAVPELVLESV